MIKRQKNKYRFFYHYYRQYNVMSVHFRGRCIRSKEIECRVPCETHWNKTQPYLVLRGYCTEVIDNGNKIIIQ